MSTFLLTFFLIKNYRVNKCVTCQRLLQTNHFDLLYLLLCGEPFKIAFSFHTSYFLLYLKIPIISMRVNLFYKKVSEKFIGIVLAIQCPVALLIRFLPDEPIVVRALRLLPSLRQSDPYIVDTLVQCRRICV